MKLFRLGGISGGSEPVKASVLAGTYTATVADGYVVDQIQWLVNGASMAGATGLTWTPSPPLLPSDKVRLSYNVVQFASNTLTVVPESSGSEWEIGTLDGFTVNGTLDGFKIGVLEQ